MNQLELLAPAGDFEIAKEALNAGADAVYFAGNTYGARAYAKNFSGEEILNLLEYAHLRRKKAYLTVNTLTKDFEMGRTLYDFMKPLYEGGLDGVILQDFGVVSFFQKYFPDLHLHGSTQMTVSSPYGARYLKDLGLKRVVAPRELSVSELAALVQEGGLEVEAFIHGALCVSYSGKCLMSSMIGGRSGNRGRCAQPCRLPYEVFEHGKKVKTPGPYVLSLKDLCGINQLYEMQKAGVKSLKIEGRMKSLEYTTGVVSVYREVLNQLNDFIHTSEELQQTSVPSDSAFKSDSLFRPDFDAEKLLLSYGNRSGFTDTYFSMHNGKDMVTFEDSSHHKGGVSKAAGLEDTTSEDACLKDAWFALDSRTNQNKETTSDKLPVQGFFSAKAGEKATLSLWDDEVSVTTLSDQMIEPAKNQGTTKEDVISKLSALGNTEFVFSALDIEMEENLFLPGGLLKKLRRQAVEEFQNEKLQKAGFNMERKAILYSETEQVEISAQAAKNDYDDVFCKNRERFYGASFLTKDQFKVLFHSNKISAFFFPGQKIFEFSEEIKQVKNNTGKYFIKLPVVLRREFLLSKDGQVLLKELPAADGIMVHGPDGLNLCNEAGVPNEKIYFSPLFYTMNRESVSYFKTQGYLHFSYSYELNYKEMRASFTGENAMEIFTLYGYYPLMHMANCTNKNLHGCDHCPHTYTLRDKSGHEFYVQNDCATCTNVVYNGSPTDLFSQLDKIQQLPLSMLLLDFTLEGSEDVERVLGNIDSPGKADLKKGSHTKGHFMRGVE